MTKLARLLGTAALVAGAPAAIAADSGLMVFEYAGFENPAFHAKYIEQHGDSPTFTFFGDEEEALQKILFGFRTDVSGICAGSVQKWIDSGIIEPWDTARIEAWDTIDKNLTGQQVAGADADVWFVPTYFGSSAISYNTDEVPAEDVASLNVFLDPKYQGRTSISDNVDDAYALAYLATGVTDWTAVTDEQFAAASDWLRKATANGTIYWDAPSSVAQMMTDGLVLLAWTWNETFPTLTEEGFPIGYQREAAEGSSLWVCGLVNLKDGPGSEDKVYDYVNAFLDPSSTEELISSGYGQANAAGMDAIDQAVVDGVGLGDVDVPIFAQLPISVDSRQRHAAEFEKIKAGF